MKTFMHIVITGTEDTGHRLFGVYSDDAEADGVAESLDAMYVTLPVVQDYSSDYDKEKRRMRHQRAQDAERESQRTKPDDKERRKNGVS